MSDIYIPSRSRSSSFGPSSELLRAHQIDLNAEIIVAANPWMANDLDTLQRLAQSGADPEQLATNAGALAGMETLDRMRTSMEALDPIAQRAVYGKLSEQQQRGLNQMGFQPVEHDDGNSLIGGIIGGTAGVIGAAMSPVKTVLGGPLSDALSLLTWVGDVPAHFYRAIRQMDGWQQWLAFGAAAAAMGVVAFASAGTAIPGMAAVAAGLNGAGALATLGAVGGAGLATATLATIPFAVTNQTEWWDAMNPWGRTGVGRGERIFSKNAQVRSREILGQAGHLDAMARDIAVNLNLEDLAQDLAGVRDSTNLDVLAGSVAKTAAGMADVGTEAYEKIYGGLMQLVQEPEFFRAVDELQQSKISPGRDVANLAGLEQGDKFFSFVSGATDALWMFTMDPTMAAGKLSKLRAMSRRGFEYADDILAAQRRISEMVASDSGVRAAAKQIGESITMNDFTKLPKQWRGNHESMMEWFVAAKTRGGLIEDTPEGVFLQYMGEGSGLQALIRGKGTVKGQELIRLSTGADSAGWGKFVAATRNLQRGISDPALLDDLFRTAKSFGAEANLERALPYNIMDNAVDMTWARKTLAELDPTEGAYKAGESIGKVLLYVPGGRTLANFIGSVSTMMPAGKAIALTDMVKAGDNALQNATTDIPRFIETMGRHFNLPSGVRDEWLRVTMQQGTVAQRRSVLTSFVESTFAAGGMRSTDEVGKIVDTYIRHWKQAYQLGGKDMVTIKGVEHVLGSLPDADQAVFMVMPNLREMVDVVRQGHILRNVTRLTDSNFVEASMSRFIKPAWLLRIGFIPRAGGEELLAFLLRMSEGGLMQEFGARSIAMGDASIAARKKLAKAGGDIFQLSPLEVDALRYRTVSHLRPLARIGERVGWDTPQRTWLTNYSDWTREALKKGVLGGDANTFGADLPVAFQNILLGKQFSARRMIANGVDPAKRLAADDWITRHSRAVMEAASTSNASLADPSIMNPDTESVMLRGDDGVRRPVSMLVTGERVMTGPGDDMFANGVHEAAARAFGDEVVSEPLATALADYVPASFTNLDDSTIAHVYENVIEIKGYSSKQILLEMLKPQDDALATMTNRMVNDVPEIGNLVRRSTVDGKIDFLKLRDSVDVRIEELTKLEMFQERALLYQLREDMNQMEGVLSQLAELTPDEAHWMAANISRDAGSGRQWDPTALTAEAPSAPSFILRRGVPDLDTIYVRDDGALVMIGQEQSQYNDLPAISMTTSETQAMRYASKATRGQADSGMLIEFDGIALMQQYNTDIEQVMSKPYHFDNANYDLTPGPRLIGGNDRTEFTEIAFVMEKNAAGENVLVAPKGTWRIANTDDMDSIIEAARVRQTAGHNYDDDFVSKMQTTIGAARRPHDVAVELNTSIDSLVARLTPAEIQELQTIGHGALVPEVTWGAGGAATRQSLFKPGGLDNIDGHDELVAKLRAWRDANGENIDAILNIEEMNPAVIDDALMVRAGHPGVIEKEDEFRHQANVLQRIGSTAEFRGKGAWDLQGTQQFSPLTRDYGTMRDRLVNEVSARLMQPEYQRFTSLSERTLQMPDGAPVARAPERGLKDVWTPVVPADVGGLMDQLNNLVPAVPDWMDDAARSHVTALDALGRQARLLASEFATSGADNSGAINMLARRTEEQLRNLGMTIPGNTHESAVARRLVHDMNQTLLDALDRGDVENVAELVATTIKTALEPLQHEPSSAAMARRLIAQSESRGAWDPVISAMSVEERTDIITTVLTRIDDGKGYYGQPVTVALERLAYDDPRIARWITSVLSDRPVEDLATSVGRVTVPRSAINGKGGPALSGIEIGGPVRDSQFYILDNRWIGKAEPMDARQVHMQRFAGQEITSRPKILNADGTVKDMVRDEIEFTIGHSRAEAIRAWAEQIADDALRPLKRGVEASYTYQPRAIEAATGRRALPFRGGATDDAAETEVRLARRVGTQYVPLEPGEKLHRAEELFEVDKKGKVRDAVDFGDRRYFTGEVVDDTEEIMWGLAGPMMRDKFEEGRGFALVAPRAFEGDGKMLTAAPKINKDLIASEGVRMTRSRVTDVANETSSALPNMTISKKYKAINDRVWDRIVRFGFDHVIAPSLDAIVRKPMAFHYYAVAHADGMKKLGWLMNADLVDNKVIAALGDHDEWFRGLREFTDAEQEQIRFIGKVRGDDLTGLAGEDLSRYLWSMGDSDLSIGEQLRLVGKDMVDDFKSELITKLESAPRLPGDTLEDAVNKTMGGPDGLAVREAAESLNTLSKRINRTALVTGSDTIHLGANATDGQKLTRFFMASFPEDETWTTYAKFADQLENSASGIPPVDEDAFNVLRDARRSLKSALDQVGENAAQRAIANVIPFLDSHQEKSMMAEYGRNLLPFWYAEENFIKRWARTMALSDAAGLDTIRKAQLTYMGLRSAGVVRTDDSGNDWVVYPGSGLLVEAVSKLMPRAGIEPMGVLFQAQTSSLLPGVNSSFGGASPSPFVAIPVQMITAMFPEAKNAERALLGDIGSSRSALTQFVPTSMARAWETFFQGENSSTRYASAMNAAIAYAEANGSGLPDGAAPKDVDAYLDRMRNHARIIMTAQMIAGFVSPGAPSAILTGEEQSSWAALSGIGVDDPGRMVNNQYREYVQNMGIEDGTAAFLEAFPLSDLEDIVNPLAFTTSKSTSDSGAPLPATRGGLAWYTANRDWIDASPEAGAWFLPSDNESGEKFDYYSYTQQLANGLRKNRAPDAFLTAIKYRQGASEYFVNKDAVDEALANAGNDQDTKNRINDYWDRWKSTYMAANPIFAEELVSDASRTRRARTIQQMRYATHDPSAPDSPHLAGIIEMVDAFDGYKAEMRNLSDRRDAEAMDRKRAIREYFSNWVAGWQMRYPGLDRMWNQVYEPESGLD